MILSADVLLNSLNERSSNARNMSKWKLFDLHFKNSTLQVLCSESGEINICKLVYSKTCVKGPLSKWPKMVFKTNNHLMKVKRIAECSPFEHSAILLTFIKLPFVIKIFVLSIFEWLFYTGFTVQLFFFKQRDNNFILIYVSIYRVVSYKK